MLRHYLERGLSKASLARELGVSRRTIYHWIEKGQLERELDGKPVCYGPRAAMPTKLEAKSGTQNRGQTTISTAGACRQASSGGFSGGREAQGHTTPQRPLDLLTEP
ncbi:helix-turn-helix domain-containing protein [Ectothiorhodospiraceae bacterium WFHF3C12]|nr:helix-turn-helix domain-containing protein [Ectothiorhodospiraceae bacterium WFHF3C12]